MNTIVLTYILLYMLVTKLKANNAQSPGLFVREIDTCFASVYFFLMSIRSSPTGEVHILLAIRSGNPSQFVVASACATSGNLTLLIKLYTFIIRISFQNLVLKRCGGKFLSKLVWKYFLQIVFCIFY